MRCGTLWDPSVGENERATPPVAIEKDDIFVQTLKKDLGRDLGRALEAADEESYQNVRNLVYIKMSSF